MRRARRRRTDLGRAVVLALLAALPGALHPAPARARPQEAGPAGDPPPAAPHRVNAVYAWRGADRFAVFRTTKSTAYGRESEKAVDAALDWLVRHQGTDGLWSSHGFSKACLGSTCGDPGIALYGVGVSGLALLALLGRGAPAGDAAGAAATRGLDVLVAVQDAEGCYGPRTTAHFLYSHAIALAAVAEAAALTGSPPLLASATRGAAFLEAARNPYRGWRYGVRPQDNDTSVTAWASMGMVAAGFAGIPVDHEAPAGVGDLLALLTSPDGRVGYTVRGNGPARPTELMAKFPAEKSESMSAAGHLTRLWLGLPPFADGRTARGVERVAALLPAWDASGGLDQYFWHWATLLLFQEGGKDWERWQGALVPALVGAQHGEKEECRRGSWDARDPWGPDGGRVYATAMAALALEAPYRFTRFRDAPPDRTTLVVRSDPEGAEVRLGVRLLGVTPLQLAPPPPGRLELRLVHPLRAEASIEVEIRPLETVAPPVVVLPPGTPVDLAALPSDAEVFHEGRRVGNGEGVRPGPARFRVLRRAHRSAILDVEVPAEGRLALEAPVTDPSRDWSQAALRGLPGPTGPSPDPAMPLYRGFALREGRFYCEQDGAEMVLVGVPGAKDGPPGQILMDRTEVTVDQFKKYARERRRGVPKQPSGSSGAHPVVGVSKEEAMEYASWAGKRLPTSDEWDAAARAVAPGVAAERGSRHPWGSFPSPDAALLPEGRRKPPDRPERVASLPAGMSVDGCFDLAGNAAEWVQEGWLRGGGFLSGEPRRFLGDKDPPPADAGFRCVKEIR